MNFYNFSILLKNRYFRILVCTSSITLCKILDNLHNIQQFFVFIICQCIKRIKDTNHQFVSKQYFAGSTRIVYQPQANIIEKKKNYITFHGQIKYNRISPHLKVDVIDIKLVSRSQISK